MQSSPRKIIVRLTKWVLGILLGLILLLLLVWGALQTHWGQQKLKEIAVNFLQNKLKTLVSIGSLDIKWLSRIEIKDIYLEDRAGKQLLGIGRLYVAYDISNILENELTLSEIELDSTRVTLTRSAIETKYNYAFILDAFSSGKSTPPDTSAKPFQLNLGKVNLNRVAFLMDDKNGGMLIDASLLRLQTEFKSVDLAQMQFLARNFNSDSLRCAISFTKKSEPVTTAATETASKDTSSTALRIGCDTMLLVRSNFKMDNVPDQFNMATHAGALGGSRVLFDLAKMNVQVGFVKLLDHSTSISMVSIPKTKPQQPTTKSAVKIPTDSTTTASTTSNPFTFKAGKIEIDRNAVQFDDDGQPKGVAGAFDPAHLAIRDLRLFADSLEYNGKWYAARIAQMSLAEKSGFRLLSLKTRASYSDTSVALQGLQLKTQQNQVVGDAQLTYTSIAGITSQPGSTLVNLNLKKSRIQLDELLYFAPALKQNKSFQPLLGKVFYIDTRITGRLNKLSIPELVMTQDNTRLLASADVYELPDVKKMRIDLQLKELSGNRKELLGFLPKNTIPDSLLHYIPEQFKLTGSYKGTLSDLIADLHLSTSSGNIAVKGSMKNISEPKNLVYDIDLQSEEIKLGEILQDTTIGNITARVKAKGNGTDIKTANADIVASIQKAQYMGYTYSEVDVDAKLHNNTINAIIDSHDPNLNLHTKTMFNMDKVHGSFTTETAINKVDLYKLGLFKDTLTFSGKIDANIPQLDTAQVNGDVLVSAVEMDYQGKLYRMDSLSFSAVYANDTQSMKLKSPFADASLIGKFTLTSIPAAAKTIANRYFYTNTDKDTSFTAPMEAKLEANIHVPDSLLGLLPGVKMLSPFTLNARIDTDSSILGFNTRINKLFLNDMIFDTITISGLNLPSIDSIQTMKYGLQVEHVTSSNFMLEKSMVLGTMRKGIIDGKIELDDANEKPRYIIPYTFTNNPGLPQLKIGDSLLIDRKEWAVNKENIIYLNVDSLKGSNLIISDKDESISIKADTINSSGLPLILSLNDFHLKNVSDVFVSDTSLVEGTVNGNVSVLSFEPIQFTSNINVDSLKLKEINAGHLVIDVKQEVPNEMQIDVNLKGSKNDVVLNGKYLAKEAAPDLHLKMGSFDLQNIEPFMNKYLGKLQGRIKGDISVKGTVSAPEVRGNLRTDSVDLVYKDYGTGIRIPAGELLFTEEGLRFNQFEFLDSAGHKGQLEGGIKMKSLGEYQVDTKITTHRYLVIDRKRSPEQMIFGPTWADAVITLKGNQELINMEGTIKVIDSSKLTYINSSSGAMGRGEGLIEFFDPLHPTDTLTLKGQKKTVTTGPKFALNTYINVTPTSKITIVLDEFSGDQLVVQGTAALNFSMGASGNMNLTGNYEVEKGDYDLSLAQLIKRKFSIVKGSRITWNGDPLKADLNINALYKVRTTAAELVNDIQNVPGIDKQKLDFEVYLILTKEMLKPDIKFRLDMPESDQDAFDSRVYNRIRQVNSIPSDLNKQVMGLLALNHFISENPFSSLSSTGSSMSSTVYNTAGKLLTQELTEMVGGAVKGVDIDFALDFNEDYTGGSVDRTTDLKMGISKSLADNRLHVYVGSTFALEGHNQNASSASAITGDVTLEYMLTKDGRYRIKGFRVNEEDMTFEGTIVKTGVTFVVVLEYNKIKNAFKKRKNPVD